MIVAQSVQPDARAQAHASHGASIPWLGLLIVSFLVRLPFMLDAGLTGDEVNYGVISRATTWELLTGDVYDTCNPPFFMITMRWLNLAIGEHIWAWKLMTVATNLAALVLTVVLVRRWLGPQVAVWTGWLMAINPWQVYFATEVRMYALTGLWTIIALEAADRYERRGSMGALALWAAVCAAGFWTHYSIAVVALVTGVYTLWQLRGQSRRALGWCIAGTCALGVMLIWILRVMKDQEVFLAGQPEAIWHLIGLPVIQFLGTTFLRTGVSKLWLAAGGLAALVVFAPVVLIGAVALYRSVRRGVLILLSAVLLTSVLVPVVRSIPIHSLAFSSRYTFVGNIAVLVLAAAGLCALRPRWRAVAGLGIAALTCVSLYEFAFVYAGRAFWPQIVPQARREVQEGEAILMPNVINSMRVQYLSGGGFAPTFVETKVPNAVGFVPQSASWREVGNGLRYPDTFYNAENWARLHSFPVVWYWQVAKSDTPPVVLGSAYRFDRAVTLLSGEQYGAEHGVRLVRFSRMP